MLRLTELKLPLDHAPDALLPAAATRLGVPAADILDHHVFRRGYDARRRGRISLVYTLDLRLRDEAAVLRAHADDPKVGPTPDMAYHPPVAPAEGAALSGRPGYRRPVVIGAGPCGVMAALVLAQMGLKPLLLERGKLVRERTVDTFALWRRGVLDPESNVQFGEGGAGTFSDGKLWSQVSDPSHYKRKVLEEFVRAGAPEEILVISKPHVGTFRLVTMVERIRAEVERLGGEYRFNTRVTGFHVDTGPDGTRRMRGLVLADGSTVDADHVILAPGHSARDGFAALLEAGVALHPKPISIGVRIEHPQSLIDVARFGTDAGNPLLGAADYKLVHHTGPDAPGGSRGVYSFCMCPGGQVVAATSEEGRVVTNGMSQYSRAERNANAGIVVGLIPDDYAPYGDGPLAGVAFQRHWERQAFLAGGGDYRAPAQRVGDFLLGQPSTTLGTVEPSYKPGVTPTDLALCLPDFVVAAMREALPRFEKQIPGFSMADAVMTGVETRTSSPIRIPRGADGHSTNTRGLFPAGEGAGYAGGIMTAGIDGIRAAEALARALAD
jgi:uncharacterized protein